jgi:hypothetical protein
MYAKRESRTLGNGGETLIEWALLQLRKACSTEKAAPETRARSPESGWKLWLSVKGEVPMKKRNDPPGYPDDDRITQWYNELKRWFARNGDCPRLNT